MGFAVQTLDAIVAKLQETSFGTATVERQLLPEVEKKDLTPKFIVMLETKTSSELDRTSEAGVYTIGVGYHHPLRESTIEAALDAVEDMQDWLSQRDNRVLSTPSGNISLILPFTMETPFDPNLVKEGGVFFSITTFTYRFCKNRS